MPRKCCVYGCKSNYATEDATTRMYLFPKDEIERGAWRRALPNILEKVTDHMGICSKHWPANTPMVKKRRFERPRDPPSIFPEVLNTCLNQSSRSCTQRFPEKRKVLSGERNILPDELDEFKSIDTLPPWSEFVSALKLSEVVSRHSLFVSTLNDGVYLFALDSDGDIWLRITISSNFAVRSFMNHSPVSIRDLLGFIPTLKTWSQLDAVVVRCKNTTVSLEHELEGFSKSLSKTLATSGVEIYDPTIKFLLSQLQLAITSPTSRRYDIATLRQAALIYLISSSAYSQLRSLLPLPHQRTLRSQLAGLGEVGTEGDSEEVIQAMFSSLQGSQRLCTLLFDEMYVKPSIRFRCRHLLGQALDDSTKMARTVLAIMLKPLMGGKPFVLRLLPVYLLTPAFLNQQLSSCIRLVNEHGGQVVALACDNHPTNRKCFASFADQPQPHPWIGKDSAQEKTFFLINDFVHLLKCLRNNWQTEADGVMAFRVPRSGETVHAKWKDVVQLYQSEESHIVRRTRLTHEACYPTSIQKTNVALALQVFDEKVASALKCDGKIETAVFVENIVKFWKIVNCKNPDLHRRLNDPDRKPIFSMLDEQVKFLRGLIDSFPGSGKGRARHHSLTSETKTALVHSLNGAVELCNYLLSDHGFTYVLLAEFHTDPLEAEFGVYRQMSGGNYYISVEQVLLSARLRRMKLFASLELSNYTHQSGKCCTTPLSDEELSTLDNCVLQVENLSSSEKASLYFIAGYVTFKEKIPGEGESSDEENVPASEFTEMVSRGKLSHPPQWLFHFASLCYTSFILHSPTCASRVQQLFRGIREYYLPEVEMDLNGVISRLTSCFFKGLVRKSTKSASPSSTSLQERKIAKLNPT